MRVSGTIPILSLVAALGAATIGAGCAYVTAVPVTPGSKVSGIRIYDVKPILIITGNTAKIEIIPNYNRAYALQFGAFLAKNHFQAAITNGIPTNLNANMDSTDFLKFLGELVKNFAPAMTASGAGAPTSAGGIQDRFQVFDIVFDDKGNLVGLRPLVIQSDLLKVKTSRVPIVLTPNPIVVPQADEGKVTPGPITGQ